MIVKVFLTLDVDEDEYQHGDEREEDEQTEKISAAALSEGARPVAPGRRAGRPRGPPAGCARGRAGVPAAPPPGRRVQRARRPPHTT